MVCDRLALIESNTNANHGIDSYPNAEKIIWGSSLTYLIRQDMTFKLFQCDIPAVTWRLSVDGKARKPGAAAPFFHPAIVMQVGHQHTSGFSCLLYTSPS